MHWVTHRAFGVRQLAAAFFSRSLLRAEASLRARRRRQAAALQSALAFCCLAAILCGQTPAPAPAKEPAKEPSEEGIPVTSALVINKCAACHTKDAKGNLSRISWERTTPEGWQEVLKRMVRLNGLVI